MTLNYKQFMKWQKERDTAIKSLDVKTFREFWDRWVKRGFYVDPLPDNDQIVEITLRKLLSHLATASDQEREEAKKWLNDRGFNTSLNRVGL